MKKTMVSILALSVLSVLLLSGCGAAMDNRTDTTNLPAATQEVMPEVTIMPEPNVEDGIVNDTDGIITDDDNGRTATNGLDDNGTNGNGVNTNGNGTAANGNNTNGVNDNGTAAEGAAANNAANRTTENSTLIPGTTPMR